MSRTLTTLVALCFAMAAFCAGVGGYYLAIYRNLRKRKDALALGVLGLTVSLYDIASAGLYSATGIDNGVTWQRLQLASATLISFTITWFVAIVTKRERSLFFRVSMTFFLVALGLFFLRIPGVVPTPLTPNIRNVQIGGWLQAVYYESSIGAAYSIVVPATLVVYAGILVVLVRDRAKVTDAWIIIIALGMYFLGVLHDSLVAMRVYNFIYLSEYAFLCTVVSMAHVLLRQHLITYRTVERLNNELAQRVVERTTKLVAAEKTSRETLSRLKITQTQLDARVNELVSARAQLLQEEKLKSVGRLAAGIAHEINTPVQFVGDSVAFLRDAIGELMTLIEKYRNAFHSLQDGTPAHAMGAEIAQAEEAADLPYLVENLPPAVDRSLEGLNRIATIVRSMKEFAHPDPRELTGVDLNRALQNTLTISRNEYKYVADITTDFSELPTVTCQAGEINQVFLNIIVNAAHAIRDVVKDSGARGTITVRTRQEGSEVVVAIGDTGTGIPAEIRNQVYDPFFTTKGVGEGTGQGLAIARSVIVEKHGGKLSFESEMGKGTTFYIRLPIEGPKGLPSSSASPASVSAGP